MDNNVFDLITDRLTNERLDGIILQNTKKKKTINEVDGLTEELKARNLSKEESKAVNRLISAYLTQNACYNKLTYKQGFMDCAALLMEIGMVK